jgi:hypothetical protein
MTRTGLGALLLVLTASTPLRAQNSEALNDIKAKIWEAHRSLDNLAAQGGFNPETRRPWTKQDADARWAQVQKDAVTHQTNCAAVASLPFLEKKLKELQQQSGTAVDAASK